jgi:malate synthase
MTKTEALDLLNNTVACYVEDCISTSPKEIDEVWQAFSIVEDIVERSIAEEGEES